MNIVLLGEALPGIGQLLLLSENEPGVLVWRHRYQVKSLLHMLEDKPRTREQLLDKPGLYLKLQALKELNALCCNKYGFNGEAVSMLYKELLQYCVGRVSL